MNRRLKSTFEFNIGVECAVPILNILQYAPQGHFLRGVCGWKRPFALILNPSALFKGRPCKKNHLLGLNDKMRLLAWFTLLVIGFSLFFPACSQEQAEEKTASEIQAPAPSYSGTIVALGDSLTAGLGVDEDQAYPAQLERQLQANGYNWRVVNAGVSGETSSGTRSRIEWVVTSLAPDIIILETGANDGLRGLDTELLETNLDYLVGYLKTRGIDVVLAGMQMLPNLGPEYTRAFSQIYPRLAEKHDVIFIPSFLEGVAGSDTLNQPDKLHPTAEGYTRIVETIYPFVRKAIERHKMQN